MQFSEQETTTNLKNNSVSDTLIDEIFQVLNKKEKDIIQKRFALRTEKRLTLEQIGQEYGITRERVRQIEKNALAKLKRIAQKTSILSLIDITSKVISENFYVLTEKRLIREVIKQTGGLFIENSQLIALSLEINNGLEKIKKSKNFKKSWFEAKKISKKNIDLVNTLAEKALKKENAIVPAQKFINLVQETTKQINKINLAKNTIHSLLQINKRLKKIEEGYGLTTWRSVKPKSIKDKALIILSRIKKPLHFRTIAKLIHENTFDKKKVTTQAVHNELIRYEEFVLVGRGIYALREWGFQTGTVKDVIADILRNHGPLNKSKIIEEVLKRRHVKIGTISLNLQKYPEFKRVGRAIYSIEKEV